MILELILGISLFHHKPKPPSGPTTEQSAWAKRVEENHKIVLNAITGAQAFEDDKKFAQYERPEIDAFERQIFKCTQDSDEHELDKDVDILIELGNAMQAVDDALHHEHVI